MINPSVLHTVLSFR